MFACQWKRVHRFDLYTTQYQAIRLGGMGWFSVGMVSTYLQPCWTLKTTSCCLLKGHHTTRPCTSCQLCLPVCFQLTVQYTILFPCRTMYIAKICWLQGPPLQLERTNRKQSMQEAKAVAAPVSCTNIIRIVWRTILRQLSPTRSTALPDMSQPFKAKRQWLWIWLGYCNNCIWFNLGLTRAGVDPRAGHPNPNLEIPNLTIRALFNSLLKLLVLLH